MNKSLYLILLLLLILCSCEKVEKKTSEKVTDSDQVSTTQIDTSQITTPKERPQIEVAFILDNTGSMGSMIETAKDKIWSIATSLTQTEPAPEIKMALIGYRDRGDVYITKRFDLTVDMDSIYGELMAMKAQGGGDSPESVNQALFEAVSKLSWSSNPKVYKVAFLVGDQPPHMDYKEDIPWPATCTLATEKGIVINTLLMGRDHSAKKVWEAIAQKTNGEFTSVGYDANRVTVTTPYDDSIAKLTEELDESRLYYGKKNIRKKMESRKMKSKSMMDRSGGYAKTKRGLYNITKSGEKNFLGSNELVSEVEKGKVDLDKVENAMLPKEMRKMSKTEQKSFIQNKINRRNEIKKEMKALEKQRQAYIKKDLEKRSISEEEGFSAEVYEMMKMQAEEKGLKLKGKAMH